MGARVVGYRNKTQIRMLQNVADFHLHFKNIKKISNAVKLQNFQYRLLHNKIFCNDVLYYWRKTPSQICNWCEEKKQTINHLLYNCKYARRIQHWFDCWMDSLDITFEMSLKNVVFNMVNENRTHISNSLELVIKQYLFRCKCSNTLPSVNESKKEQRRAKLKRAK